jgi:hypothetical protein
MNSVMELVHISPANKVPAHLLAQLGCENFKILSGTYAIIVKTA